MSRVAEGLGRFVRTVYKDRDSRLSRLVPTSSGCPPYEGNLFGSSVRAGRWSCQWSAPSATIVRSSPPRSPTMLSAQAYSFRMKSRLAISLSWIGGYVNVVAFLVCGTMTSHVTGSTTIALLRNVEGQRTLAAYSAFAVVAFFAGTIASAVLTEGARRAGWRSKYVVPVILEAALLALVAEDIRRTGSAHDVNDDAWWAVVGLAAAAMGIQNATIARVSGSVIRTTHMTGVVTDIGLESVQLIYRWRARLRSTGAMRASRLFRIARREPSILRILLLLSIFGSFVVGAAAGAAAFHWNPAYALYAPILFLLWIVWVDLRTPIADVRELDPLADVAVAGAGSLRELLPPSVGVYRLHSAGRHGAHRPPDFQHWVERLPRTWRVVVLCFNPTVTIDDNSAHGLVESVKVLRKDGRRLVVAGVSQAQYAAFERHGVFRTLAHDDVWPDVEFALARAVSLAEEVAPAR